MGVEWEILTRMENKAEIPPPQTRHGGKARRGRSRNLGLMEGLGDFDGEISQQIGVASQFVVIPAVNHRLGDGDFE
jgi:hypothetical protein